MKKKVTLKDTVTTPTLPQSHFKIYSYEMEAERGHRGILDFISPGLLNAFIKVLHKGHISTLFTVLLETELRKNSWLQVITA